MVLIRGRNWSYTKRVNTITAITIKIIAQSMLILPA
jgi:hypothetical protein